MHVRTKPIMAITIILIFALTLLLLMLSSVSAPKVPAASETVPITQNERVEAIERNIQNAIDAAGAGGIVTVIGSKIVDGDMPLSLEIPEGVTVFWRADYAGSSHTMISLSGSGVFEVADGGVVSVTRGHIYRDYAFAINTDAVTVNVSGGRVEASIGRGGAISGDTGTINIAGGIVSAEGDMTWTVYTHSGHIKMSGGSVRGTGNVLRSDSGSVTMSGGTVVSDDVQDALVAPDGNVIVTGGMIINSGTM